MDRPLIGIGSDVHRDAKRERTFANLAYAEALRRAGAVPLVIPPQPENLAALLLRLDGVLLAGGPDCDPAAYGEEPHPSVKPMDPRRQAADLELARLAREEGIPALGICLGMQMMNVAAGGSLIQDLETHQPGAGNRHRAEEGMARHDVIVRDGNALARILPPGTVNVNSSHHQAIGRIGAGLLVTAHAPDGIVEGLEDPSRAFFLGVQWHPEEMTGEDSADRLFAAFVEAARRFGGRRGQGTVL